SGDKNPSGDAEFACGEGYSGAVIAAGCGDDTRLRNLAQEQICKRATRFERAGMLNQFEFEDDGDGAESKVTAVGLEDWRPADVRADDFFRCSDAFSVDSCGRHGGLIPGAASEKTSQAEAGSCKKYSAPPLF